MEPYGIALIGCGTVGTGVARLLLEQPTRLADRANRPLELRRVVVRDVNKARDVNLPSHLITDEFQSVLNDPKIQLGVELVGGTEFPRRAVLDLLAAGKDVVTANKALLAHHGEEIFDAGRTHNRAVAFEASVAGGIPIISALSQSLAANQIVFLQGILNGTSNFILTGMSDHGRTYLDVLAEAQQLGYAEADPTLDVDGTDVVHKLSILAQIAFGVSVPPEEIPRQGIAGMSLIDIRFAKRLGYKIKLLAEAWLHENQLALHVSPVMLHTVSPLAQVRGPYNAINVIGDAVGDTMFYGQGAGQMPTASAVIADIIDMAVGRAQRTFQTLRLWSKRANSIALREPGDVRSRFYLRLFVQDDIGVMATVTRVVAEHGVSLASVIQQEAPEDHEGDSVPLVITTHTAFTHQVISLVAKIDELVSVTAPTVYYPMED